MAQSVGCLMLHKAVGAFFDNLLVFGIAEVRLDDRYHANVADEPVILDAVESRIKRQRDPLKRPAEPERGPREHPERIGKQHRIMDVYCRTDARHDDIPRIVFNINGFLASLVFVSRVADARSPFLATTFEPSP